VHPPPHAPGKLKKLNQIFALRSLRLFRTVRRRPVLQQVTIFGNHFSRCDFLFVHR
jgi:hypothetical protein